MIIGGLETEKRKRNKTASCTDNCFVYTRFYRDDDADDNGYVDDDDDLDGA